MSLDGVHTDEMPEPSDDLWLTGDPVLAALAEDLRIVASGPAPEPRPGLVAVMAQGRVRPSEQEPGRNKMLVKTFLGSLAAKVAMGVGLATASVAAVGATGVLPDAAQHAVASVVSATTPFSLPDPSSVSGTAATVAEDDPAGSTTTSSTSTTIAGGTGSGPTTTIAGTEDNGGTGAGGPDNHGACVSAIAQDKSGSGTDNHGKIVSTVARSDCGKTSPSTTVPGSTTSSSTSSSTSTTVANGNSGKGSSGNGNSGNGNNGNNGNGNGSGKGGKG